MKKNSLKNEYFNLWVLISLTRDSIHRARQKELDAYNLPVRQASILAIITAVGGNATLTEIARLNFRKINTVSELLNRMEKGGLVKKVKDLKRRNKIGIVLTEKGREAYYQASKRESINDIMSSLSKEERRQLRPFLEKLREKALTRLGRRDEIPYLRY
jgi:DNA-binding MarR family transcriptional regulator